MFVDPSLRDVLSPDLWIPDRTVWPGVRRSLHDAIQSVFVVTVALCQPIDRSAAPDARKGSEQMFIRQLHLANPGSQLPTWFNSNRRTTTQLVMHLFTKLADAAIIWLPEGPPERRATIASSVIPGHQPSNVTDQPHNRGMSQQKSTADSCLQSPLVCHKDSTVNLNARFDWSDRALAESDALGRSQSPSPVISSQVHHLRVTQRQCVSTFPTSAPQPQLSQQTNPSLTALPSPHQWKDHKQPTQAIEHPVLDRS